MPSPGSVLIIVENLPVPFDRRVWMEATTLRAAGYSVSVICPKGKGFEADYEQIEGIDIYRHPLPPEISSVSGYLREYAWALKWELKLARQVWRKHPFDIVHICNPPDLLFLVAAWFKIFHGVRVIFDQHDINPELYEAKYSKRGFFYYGLRWAEFLTFSLADVVISTNESYREIALRRGKKNPRRVFVVRSGPNLRRFSPVPPNPVYFRGKKYLVGYVGVMGEQEGIDYLLRAAHRIVHTLRREDIHFMLIGSGPSFESLRDLSRRLGLESFVEFTGLIPDAELIERLSTCDLCVNPDPYTPFNDRSTMNKILEYMALGKAVIQFDLLEGRRSAEGASLYARRNGEQDLAQKIIELLKAPEMREQMGKEGRRRMVDQLEWRHQAPKLLEAYRKVREG